MGYYTNYVVEAKDVYDPSVHDYISNFLEKAYCKFNQNGDSWSIDEIKWYNHVNDMINLSKKPEVKDVLFEVDGEGEDREDSWIEYYKNGKMVEYRPEVIWPKFNEDDLK